MTPLLDRMDFTWSPDQPDDRRRGFVRWPFRHEALDLRFRHPGGSSAAVRVACRNISRAGMSVLHSTFVHPGTRCSVLIPGQDERPVAVRGIVARCTHRSGVIHEVGIRFDRELDPRTFVAHDPFADWFSLEAVDPRRLKGRVVCIAAWGDQRLIAHALRDSGVSLLAESTAREGLARVTAGCELVICDLKLPDATGLEVVASLRSRGLSTPAIILTPEKNGALRRALGDLHVDAFLLKPPGPALLLRAIAEHLIVRRAERAAPETPKARTNGTGELTASSLALAALERAVVQGDRSAVRAACDRIASAGPSAAFASARLLALEAASALAAVECIHDAAESLKAMVRACRDAPLKPGL